MAYTDYTLGEDEDLIEFDTAEANREIALRMAQQAARAIHIFTTDFDPAVFDQADFAEAVAQMARRHPRARVLVLVQDPTRAIKGGHRLVELAQRLSSRVEIRKPPAEYSDLNETFMVVDGTGYFRRLLPSRYEGLASFHDPLKSRELVNQFEEVWQRAHGDPQLRRLHI